MIKAVIFDCFGVLVGSGFRDVYAALGGDADKDQEFIGEMLYKANSGSIANTEFERGITEQLGISLDQYKKEVNKKEHLNTRLFEYIESELKARYKIGLLSNANNGEIDRKIPPHLQELFDVIVVSGEVGFMKPDPHIFSIAVQRLGVKFEEAVFIDDLEHYVASASELGLQTIHYQGFESFKNQLENILRSKQ